MDKRLFLSFLFLTGCSFIPSVGPNHKTPHHPEVNEWEQRTNATTLYSNSTQDRASWWSALKDPVLDELIQKALTNNPSYEVAVSKLREARADTRVLTGSFLPSIDAAYSANRSGTSENTPNADMMPSPSNTYQAGFDASWEIDLFGGSRRAYQASLSEEIAADAALDDAGVSIAAEVTKNYIELRAFEKRVQIAENNLKIQSESRDLVKAKFEAGVSSELDLAQANSQLEATRATVPTLQGELKRRLYKLATLCGESPIHFVVSGNASSIPKISSAIDISQPSEFLRSRPDVRIAEQQLAAQTARIGVAISDIFPKITLVGSIGVNSDQSGSLFDANSRTWSVGPSISMPIFHGGKILANINVQEERAQQAAAHYEQTVLAALEDAQNSLNAYSFELDRVASLERALTASNRALDLSKDLYAQGVIDFLRVIEAQRAALLAEDAFTESTARVALSGISVYKAFAGGLPCCTNPTTH